MANDLRIVSHRPDALTLAYRVSIVDEAIERLKDRGDVARRHGRAAFTWTGPDDLRKKSREPGAIGARWAEARGADKPIVCEIAAPRVSKTWDLRAEGVWRMRIQLNAPGAIRMVHDETGEIIEEPGWNVEIVWYAATLAIWRLDHVLAESAALAWQFGVVHEQRLRRIDLCADVAGWEIRRDDIDRIVKRPRCAGPDSHNVFGIAEEPDELERLGQKKNAPAPQMHMTGGHTKRRVCGLSVGRGGALMCRVYDKALEVSTWNGPTAEAKREAERGRWTKGGWDGASPVTRVEFQIRGVALAELGLRDPEAVLAAELDYDGKAIAHRVLMGEDGRAVDIVGRLPWIWKTMIRWCRIVLPDPTVRYATRLHDDPRWALLREVDFGAIYTHPIKRFRKRAAASEAQALGVALSRAAVAGELDEAAKTWSESRYAYGTDSKDPSDPHNPRWLLELRVQQVIDAQVAGVVKWLLKRSGGDPVEANIHLAVRARAAWARRAQWGEQHEELRPDPKRDDRRVDRSQPAKAPVEQEARRVRDADFLAGAQWLLPGLGNGPQHNATRPS